MKIQTIFVRTVAAALVASAAFAFTAAPARADVAIEGGAAITGSNASGAGAISLGLINAPLVPLSVDLTGLVAGNGGFATTLDARFHFSGTAVGAGLGFGSLGATSHVDGMYDALIAQTIAPHTAIEARMYFGPTRPSTLFAGLRFSL